MLGGGVAIDADAIAFRSGASPYREMFANDRFMRGRPWQGELTAHIYWAQKVRHSSHWSNG
jgi:hypothetical protein